MGKILTNTSEYDSVRAALGVSADVLPDARITNITFLQVAEALIARKIAAQFTNGVAPLNTIMAYTDTDPLYFDQVFLKAACAFLVAGLFGSASRNAIITGVKDGDLEFNYGTGIAEQWAEQEQNNYGKYAYYLQKITNWKVSTSTVFSVSGPTAAGTVPNTLSGFSIPQL